MSQWSPAAGLTCLSTFASQFSAVSRRPSLLDDSALHRGVHDALSLVFHIHETNCNQTSRGTFMPSTSNTSTLTDASVRDVASSLAVMLLESTAIGFRVAGPGSQATAPSTRDYARQRKRRSPVAKTQLDCARSYCSNHHGYTSLA